MTTEPADDRTPSAKRFTHLPARVDPNELTTSQPPDPARDTDHDAEHEFLLRYGTAGGEWDLSDS